MKKYKAEYITKPTESVKSIVCNSCGEELDVSHIMKGDPEKDWLLDEYTTLTSQYFGYGSEYDGEHWTIDLCGSCTENLLDSLKHSPRKHPPRVTL